MNKVISWTAYLWLLAIEAGEQLVESVRERYSAAEVRNTKSNDSCRLAPPTAVR
jgi:hypothetical protein